MKWLDRLLGRSAQGTDRADDEQALDDLREAFRRVHRRTDRLVDDYRRADLRRPVRKS
jgi:hypothetical protein